MKMTKTILQISLVGLFLMTTLGARGQTGTGTIERAPVNVGPVNTDHENAERNTILTTDVPAFSASYEELNAVLFYNGQIPLGPGLTLVASRSEDLTGLTTTRPAGNFTHYQWFYMGQDGVAEDDGTAFNPNLVSSGYLNRFENVGENKLTIENLSEGYHYFKVRGIVNPENIENFEGCETQDEVFVVFVLPQLDITPNILSTLSDGTNPVYQYCEIEPLDPTGQTKVSITTTYDFVNTNTPTADQFDVKYRWYSVKADAAGDYPTAVSSAVTNPESIEGVDLLETSPSDVSGGTLPAFNPQMTEIGQYKIFVEVEYTVKDRNEGKAADTDALRQRDYVIYRGWAGGTDLATATEITITPRPGKPHITIEGVND